MKGVFYIVVLLLITVSSFAQNLVTNGSFESYTTCPGAPSQFAGYCNDWGAYTNGTPEYYNACSTGNVGIPSNVNGNQPAASGNAYAGIIDYAGPSTDFREYITTSIPALLPGATYEVSIMVSLADKALYASNGLGVYFFHNAPSSVATTNVLPITPQVSYASYGPVTGKTAWTKLVKTFVADSAYDKIVIGGFLNNATVQTTTLSGTLPGSYYYIDSVVVRFADTISLKVNDTMLCRGNVISVPYAVNAATPFSSGNVFTLELSNNLGSFASPTGIGSVSATTSGSISATIPVVAFSSGAYRMRIVASSPPYTSADNGVNIGIGNAIPVPVAHITSPVCLDDTFTVHVTSPTNLTDAVWNGPRFVNSHASSITIYQSKSSDAGVYTVKAYNYGCFASASNTLVVTPSPTKPVASSNSPICSGDTLILTGQTSGTTDSWSSPAGNIHTSKNIKLPNTQSPDSGQYILTTTLNGCISRDTVLVKIKDTPIPDAAVNSPCEGSNIILTSGYMGAATKYSWAGPGGFNSSVQNNSINNATAGMSGKYYISITAPNGCIGRDTVTLIVKPLPAKTNTTGNNVLCEGDTLNLKATNNTSTVTFKWSGPGGFNVTGAVALIEGITKSNAGKYIVKADLNGCTTIDSLDVVVKHTPLIPDAIANTPLTVGENLQLQVTNVEAGVNYSWAGPAGFNSTSAAPLIPGITKQHAGTYIVTATLDGGCMSNNMVLVTIDDKVYSGALEIYPNASNGNFKIRSSTKFDQVVPMKLYNDRGRLVYESESETHNKVLDHTVLLKDAIADGVYFLRLILDGKSINERVVINRQ